MRLRFSEAAPAERRQARSTSMIDDICIWKGAPDVDPARTDLKAILEEHACKGKRLGVEWDAHGLTAIAGETVLVTDTGCERLSRIPPDYVRNA